MISRRGLMGVGGVLVVPFVGDESLSFDRQWIGLLNLEQGPKQRTFVYPGDKEVRAEYRKRMEKLLAPVERDFGAVDTLEIKLHAVPRMGRTPSAA